METGKILVTPQMAKELLQVYKNELSAPMFLSAKRVDSLTKDIESGAWKLPEVVAEKKYRSIDDPWESSQDHDK